MRTHSSTQWSWLAGLWSAARPRGWRSTLARIAMLGSLCVACCAPVGAQNQPAAEIAADSPRRTEIVRLIERSAPAVVSLRNLVPDEKPDTFRVVSGSGSIIHPAGYILTNYHVVRTFVRGEVILADGRVLPYQVVCAYPPDDLALIRIPTQTSLLSITLGRSDDLMLGEPALVIGNPDGLMQSASTGIVSGLSRAIATPDAFLPWMIQTTAAINGGNSGGPLINALGHQIGLITSKNQNADNIGFAIAIDRVRMMFPQMVAAEARFGFYWGADVAMLTAEARVDGVAAGSPAAASGLVVGDIITAIGEFPIRTGVDVHLAMIGRKPDETMRIGIRRDGQALTLESKLAPPQWLTSVSEEALVPGLDYAVYEGTWPKLPDFSELKPVSQGSTAQPDTGVHGSGKDHFGVMFSGYVKLPAEGLYAFFTKSDDGSQLRLGDRLIVDNDGLHPAQETAGLIRLKAGVYPLEVRYFEAQGDEMLQVSIEGPGLPKQPIPPTMYLRAEK